MRFLGEREFSSQTQCLVLGSIKKKAIKQMSKRKRNDAQIYNLHAWVPYKRWRSKNGQNRVTNRWSADLVCLRLRMDCLSALRIGDGAGLQFEWQKEIGAWETRGEGNRLWEGEKKRCISEERLSHTGKSISIRSSKDHVASSEYVTLW